jgi:opacity protein-like surface antigen
LAYDAPLIPSKTTTIVPELQPVFIFTAGASIFKLGQSQSFAPLDLCSYNYHPNGANTANMLWGGFIGSEVKQSPSWGIVAGLGYYQPNDLSTQGILTQGADALSSDTYSYRYRTQSQQVLAEGKWFWIAKEQIQPFLMAGIGAAFNKTFNYQTNVPPFLEFTPEFFNHTKTNFTYVIGPGIDIRLTKSFRIGVAYRFADLGSANTGSAQLDEIPISSTLKQSHLYANQIIAQFTFIPGKRAEG